MAYFLYRLNPPRTTFLQDMTPDEEQLMQQHSTYWKTLLKSEVAIAFGPVANPSDPHGICILQAANRQEVDTLAAEDPCIKANRNFSFDIYVLPALEYTHQVR